MKRAIPLMLCASLLLAACDLGGPKTAVVDVAKVLSESRHAKQAQEENRKAQEIFQNNLNAIEKKLSAYKDKKQAEAYLLEAARQLQAQLNSARAATAQAMGNGLKKVLDGRLDEYDLILPRSGTLASRDALDVTAAVLAEFDKTELTWPPLPRRVDDPQLPPDSKAAEKKPAADKEETSAQKDTKKDAKKGR